MDNQMKELRELARSYSDTKILNTITQSEHFSKTQVEAAKAIATERNIISGDEASTKSLDHIREAKRMLEDRMTIDEVKLNLEQRGVSSEDAESAIHQASKVANLNKKEEIQEEESSGSSWMWILGALFIVRMIMRAFRDNSY